MYETLHEVCICLDSHRTEGRKDERYHSFDLFQYLLSHPSKFQMDSGDVCVKLLFEMPSYMQLFTRTSTVRDELTFAFHIFLYSP